VKDRGLRSARLQAGIDRIDSVGLKADATRTLRNNEI
jgi:hypothetical protein